jgi:DTW domain-containing protein YfiP
MLDLNFYLLTHERELDRETSTSIPVREVLAGSCRTTVWKRKEPDGVIASGLSAEDTVLVYPADDGQPVESLDRVRNFVVIDGTWQEARKIYNRSPYLKRFPVLGIKVEKRSAYRLRRNQQDGGLCTAETVAEILRLKGDTELAERILERLAAFQDR